MISQAFLSDASVLSRADSWEAVLLPRAPKLSVPKIPDCRQALVSLCGSSVFAVLPHEPCVVELNHTVRATHPLFMQVVHELHCSSDTLLFDNSLEFLTSGAQGETRSNSLHWPNTLMNSYIIGVLYGPEAKGLDVSLL